jgi:hypothetical protein
MSGLVDPLGKPIAPSGEVVTPAEYMEGLGRRAGFDHKQREFLRKNLPSATDAPPDHMSKSQRQIAALRQSLMKIATDNLQLWMIVGAFAARAGGKATFSQPEVMKFQKPANWPVVMPDEDRNIVVTIGLLAKPAEVPVETPA